MAPGPGRQGANPSLTTRAAPSGRAVWRTLSATDYDPILPYPLGTDFGNPPPVLSCAALSEFTQSDMLATQQIQGFSLL